MNLTLNNNYLDSNNNNNGLAIVSYLDVFFSAFPLLLLSGITWIMNLGVIKQIWVSSARTYVQLAILGHILKPIMFVGNEHSWVLFIYLTAMVALSAMESSSRPKYRIKKQYFLLLATIGINVAMVSTFAFLIIIRAPKPLDPQYVIPICGMLFGNVITASSLSLNNVLTSFVEQKSEIDLLLSFGATKYEASIRLLRDAVRAGSMPTLNSMAVIGLVSIPGMMTGQVLGGSSPDVAARYQMLIMYLIAACGLGSILTVIIFVMSVLFTSKQALKTDVIVKASKSSSTQSKNWRERLHSSCSNICNFLCICRKSKDRGYISFKGGSNDKPLTHDSQEYLFYSSPLNSQTHGTISPVKNISIHTYIRSSKEKYPLDFDGETYLKIKDVSRSVYVNGSNLYKKILFTDLNYNLGKGEIAFVTGPSGAGKSQFLRLVAGLEEKDNGEIFLSGKSQKEFPSWCMWRKRVLYVTQYKVNIPGTPETFVERISELKVNKYIS